MFLSIFEFFLRDNHQENHNYPNHYYHFISNFNCHFSGFQKIFLSIIFEFFLRSNYQENLNYHNHHSHFNFQISIFIFKGFQKMFLSIIFEFFLRNNYQENHNYHTHYYYFISNFNVDFLGLSNVVFKYNI